MEVDYIIYLSIISIEFLLGLLFYKRISPSFRIIVPILFFVILCEIISRITIQANFLHSSNPPYHFHVPIHYALVAYFYTVNSRKSRFLLLFSYASSFGIFAFSLVNLFFFQNLRTFPSNSMLISSVFILFLVLYSFIDMLHKIEPLPLTKQGLFWFNAANLILYSTSFFYWGLFNLLLATRQFPMVIFYIISTLSIISYIFYGFSLYFGKKTPVNEIRKSPNV
jgi:hypothetical protein